MDNYNYEDITAADEVQGTEAAVADTMEALEDISATSEETTVLENSGAEQETAPQDEAERDQVASLPDDSDEDSSDEEDAPLLDDFDDTEDTSLLEDSDEETTSLLDDPEEAQGLVPLEEDDGAQSGESNEEDHTQERVENETTGSEGGRKRPQLVTVVGVRFRTAGKAYYFSPGEFQLRHGSHVIVETARGVEYGTVVSLPMQIDRRRLKSPVKEVLRPATREDDTTHQENQHKEREAYRICFKKIREHHLDMKLIDAEYTFDRSKILFYFTADGRVDFRDLVKDLAGIFRTRVELRQIGVRDETKILGGYGSCGRPLCCHTYLSDFVPVSIKMAKEQNLSLNPTKISGVCGRLMCCLKNEAETYEELNKNLPRQGDEVEGPDGLQGEVESVNVLRQKVRILVEIDDEKEIHEYNADEITMIRRRKRGEAKHRAKRIENGQERADELRPTERRNRPTRANDAERAPRDQENDRPARGTEGGRPTRGADTERPARGNGEHGAQAEGQAERRERRKPGGRQGGRGSREDRQNGYRGNREGRENPNQRENRDQNGTARENRDNPMSRENRGGNREGRENREGRSPYKRGGRDQNGSRNGQERTENGERTSRNSEDRQNGGQSGNYRRKGRGRNERRDGQAAGGQNGSESHGGSESGGEN